MFSDLGRLAGELRSGLESIASEVRAARGEFDRFVRQHYGDRVKDRPWGPKYGTASLAPGASKVLLLVDPVTTATGQAGVVTGWAVVADQFSGGPGGGVIFGLEVAGRPHFNLSELDSKIGSIGAPLDTWIPFGSMDAVTIRARNTHALDTFTIEAQMFGRWYDANEGRR